MDAKQTRHPVPGRTCAHLFKLVMMEHHALLLPAVVRVRAL